MLSIYRPYFSCWKRTWANIGLQLGSGEREGGCEGTSRYREMDSRTKNNKKRFTLIMVIIYQRRTWFIYWGLLLKKVLYADDLTVCRTSSTWPGTISKKCEDIFSCSNERTDDLNWLWCWSSLHESRRYELLGNKTNERYSSTFFFAPKRIRKRSKQMLQPHRQPHCQQLISQMLAWNPVLISETPVMKLKPDQNMGWSKQHQVWSLGRLEQNWAWKRDWKTKECMLYSRKQKHDSRIV